nr:unnamed protein product [Digitaria exilis]CAB3504720.1 unnamed protein product [Digitaria exilis]
MAPAAVATQRDGGCSLLSAQVVGRAFTRQYYDILRTSPDKAYMFYHDDSILAWPSAYNGADIDSVTTIPAIKARILEMVRVVERMEVLTVDAHNSYTGGITVLVTGRINSSSSGGKLSFSPLTFVQSFFLAPQDTGYFVLNDTLRYVVGRHCSTTTPATTCDVAVAAGDEKARSSSSEPAVVAVPATKEKTCHSIFEEERMAHGAETDEENGFVLVDQ